MFYTSPHCTRLMNYYSNNTVPDHYTDGIIRGQPYATNYATRRAVAAPLTITILDRSLGTNTAYVKVKVTLESSLPAGHEINVALWEDNVVVGGTYGSTPCRMIERDWTSTALTITNANQSQEFEHTFTTQSSWVPGNLGVTAWVQGNSGDREAHNATATKFAGGAGIAPASLGRVKAAFN